MHSNPVSRRSSPTRRAVLGTIAGLAAAGVAGGYAWDHLGNGSDDRARKCSFDDEVEHWGRT
jgi:hypothetical protein